MTQQILYRGCRYVEAATTLPHQTRPSSPTKRRLVPAIRVEDGTKVMVAPETLKSQPQQYQPRPGPDKTPSPEMPRPDAPTTPDTARPESPHAVLTQAMRAKRVAYRVPPAEASSDVLPEQLPETAQHAVREQLRGLLGYLNIHHHGLKRQASVYRFQQSLTSLGQYDMTNGAIYINEDVHRRAAAYLNDPRNPKHKKYTDDASTLIHETIHSMSPMVTKVYDAHAAFTEEATTEMLARRVMREQFGVPDEKWRDKDGTPTGSYAEEIHSMNQLVSQVVGEHVPVPHHQIYRMIEDAAVKMRQQQPRSFDRKNKYVQHFADSLELPPAVFAGLDADAAATRRQEIANRIATEIERQHHDWVG